MYQKRTNRKKQKENTKQKVYLIARRLFKEKGFDNVTIEEIAGAADVSVGTIYFHFNSKQEIMAEYHSELDQAYSDYFNRQRTFPDYITKNSLEKIYDFVMFCCGISSKLGVENIRVVYPYMMCNEAFGSRMLNTERSYYRILDELVSEGQKSGEISRGIDHNLLISDITILMRGCILNWCIYGGVGDICRMSSRLVLTYLDSLRVDSPALSVLSDNSPEDRGGLFDS